MKNAIRQTLVPFVCSGLLFAAVFKPAYGDETRVSQKETSGGREVWYVSGKTVYVEELRGNRWIGCGWSADGATSIEKRSDSDAFELRMKDQPTPITTPGTLLSTGWKWVSSAEVPSRDATSVHFVVRLSNDSFPVEVEVHTLLDGTPVLTRWLTVANRSAKPLALTTCIPWCGRLWSESASVALCHSLRYQNSWEGWLGWTSLDDGPNVFEQKRGSKWDDPCFVLRNDGNGEYFFGQLAWPESYVMEFQKSQGIAFKTGPIAANALRVLAPGETVTTPAVHLGNIKGDFDATVQAMHEHIRRSVLPKQKPERRFLIQYLSPEDQPLTVYHGDQYNEANLKRCMDVAAACGMEVFIVDGPSWAEGYGNWVPKAKWFPQGFDPLRQYAHAKGLLFAVYAEPEGGRGDWSQTAAFRAHPKWFERVILNISIPEAAAYMEAEWNGLVNDLKLDLYRHDINAVGLGDGTVTVRDGFPESDHWRHYDAFYAMTDRIRSGHPNLILQQASGGGTRLDLATAAHWDEHFASDRGVYPFVYRMASGVSVYLPPEILVLPHGLPSWFGPNGERVAVADGGVGGPLEQPDLVTMLRGVYALGNTPMIFNAMLPKRIDDLTPDMREKFLRYAATYKEFIRPMLPTCKVYHHAPINATGGVESGNWFAMEFSSPDKKKAWATVIRLSRTETDAYLFKPRGLDAGKTYRVTSDNTASVRVVEGATLMRDGVSIRLDAEPLSELLLIEAQ